MAAPSEKSAVDWSMTGTAAGLVDWRTASRTGRRVAGNPQQTALQRGRMAEDFQEVVTEAEGLVTDFTGLAGQGPSARPWVMTRAEWIDQNIRGFQRSLEPLARRILEERSVRLSAGARGKFLGAQVGVLMGYVSRKVLGQYDLFLPADDEGLLYFVGANVAGVEGRFRFPRRGFRLWLALHEVTHRVQFGAVAWLRPYLLRQIDAYLSTVDLDPSRIREQLKHAIGEIRSGRARGQDLIVLLMTPEQHQIFERMQALMSLLEGHASYVMERAAADRIADAARMQRALQDRRRSSRLERGFQRAIGFDTKVRQYGAGERFVRRAVEVAGMEGLNRVWESESNLPTLAEVADPDRWVSRVLSA